MLGGGFNTIILFSSAWVEIFKSEIKLKADEKKTFPFLYKMMANYKNIYLRQISQSGKCDRRRLPRTCILQESRNNYCAATTPTQECPDWPSTSYGPASALAGILQHY